MRNIARLSDNDRRELFRNTADKMGLNDAIVEKDFWVCFTLDYLFHRSPWKESIGAGYDPKAGYGALRQL